MHPALSVIVFTSASGAGYGLLAFCGLFVTIGLVPPGSGLAAVAIGLALVLVTGGLLASTAHLGRPERAWRALSQWRSSWLSREGCLAVLVYPPAFLFLLGQLGAGYPFLAWPGWGPIAAALALATVFATGKIYATLRPIRQWNNGQVVPGYLLIGLLGGVMLLSFLASVFDAFRENYAWICLILAILTGMLKMSYWRSISDDSPVTTVASATGLGEDGETVRLLDAPNTSENFVMREMGFRIARRHATRLRQIGTTTLFGLPAIVALCAMTIPGQAAQIIVTLIGVLSVGLGTIVERWLFFAEARHAVTLYYGADAV